MYTFKKAERLTGKKNIEILVKKGNFFSVFPFRVLWKETESHIIYPAQVAVSVSKRNFKKAVHRNKIKRQIREAYRKNKEILHRHLEAEKKKINLVIIYSDKEMPESKTVEKKMAEIVQKLVKKT